MTSSADSSGESAPPPARTEEVQLPAIVNDPRPALGIGIAIFLIAGIAIATQSTWTAPAALTCWAGVVAGALGWGVYAWQRTAVRRGAQWVQDGLDG